MKTALELAKLLRTKERFVVSPYGAVLSFEKGQFCVRDYHRQEISWFPSWKDVLKGFRSGFWA